MDQNLTSPKEDLNPRPNPSRGDNPENALYQAWKIAESRERPALENSLLQHLRRHAAKVCWMVLHSHQPDLVDEISQDAIMDLASFGERSAFATWFHARALNRLRLQRRQNIRRKEVPLDVLQKSPIADSVNSYQAIEASALVQEMLTYLTPFELNIVQLKMDDGLTDMEIGIELGYTREWIQITWAKVLKKLKEKYNG